MSPFGLARVLRRIDNRRTRLNVLRSRADSGYPEYEADGWKFCVFDDCGSWDYLEWVEAPTGERVEYPMRAYDQLSVVERLVNRYAPKNESDWGY